MYENPYTPDPLSFEDFQTSNFLIIENLCAKNIFSGHLTLNLKFRNLLTDKVYLTYMPIYQKRLFFDDNFNAFVGDMTAQAAAEDERKFLSKQKRDI